MNTKKLTGRLDVYRLLGFRVWECEFYYQTHVMLLNKLTSMDETTQDLIKNKLWASWDIARSLNENVANVFGWGSIFYHSLTMPASVHQFQRYVKSFRLPRLDDQGKYPFIRDESARTHFTASEGLTAEKHKRLLVFGRSAFVTEFRFKVTRTVNFRYTLFPGALKALNQLKSMGPTRIWTEGDMRGGRSTGWPGSGEQQYKLESAGVFSEYCKTDQHTVIADEDKFRFLADVVDQLITWGTTHIFVLDDKTKNLDKAKRKIERSLQELSTQKQVTVIRMAIGNGQRGLQPFQLEECEVGARVWDIPIVVDDHRITPREYYSAVKNITQAPNKVREILSSHSTPKKPAFILDWDRVFSNDVARQVLQQASVLELFD